ncbi:MAG: protein kinase [Gemmatimonadaceae bacterium]|nr:protein kinase [Gemmatimonadaceae bacterium]
MTDPLRERVGAALGGTYEIEGELGRGGMGVVYRAMDRKLRRAVAIKVLPPELAFRDDVRQRFLREAQTAAQLNHPNIVPIYAVEERDGLVCFVMALVEGEPLALRLATNPRPPVAEVCRILRGVADALAYAHGRGIVHRDVKPDNILIDRATGRPMVTDFGIARAAEGDARLTVTGIAVGTPAYMSPEQAMGEREIDGRSDLYSLAIVAYQMLVGELPFQAGNTPAMLMKHISDTPRPLREYRRDLSPLLVAAIERAMAKRPSDRWDDAGAFRDAIAAVEGGVGALPPASLPPAATRAPAESPRDARLSSAWKHAAPRPSARPTAGGEGEAAPRAPDGAGLAASVRAIVRGVEHQVADQARYAQRMADEAARDAIEAANAGWGGAPRRAPNPGMQPMPAVPSWMPESWREVREQSRMTRRDARSQRAALRGRESLDAFQQLGVVDRIRAFRRRAASSVVTVGFLGVINAMFTPDFPWVIFPALAMTIPLAQRFASLWADGVRLRDIFGAEASRALKAHGEGAAMAVLPTPTQAAQPMVPPDVLAGTYGEHVRRAASDRRAVHEVLAKLTKADKDLIPDVAPTVDSLTERVASLAQALHRLEDDVQPAALEALDQRIAAAREQPESRERDQKVALLERQRATLADLASRHETLRTQLESASLVLQNMRLDMIALRSAGVQSAIDDVSSATQEARAVSRDIAHVLDAARQVR